MDKKDLVLVGGGGHCKSCIDVIETEGRFCIVGVVDLKEKRNEKILDYEIIANDNDLPDLAKKYDDFFVTIGGVKDLNKRRERFERLKELEVSIPVIISPQAHVAKSARIGDGTIVMHKAVVNADANLGQNVIINTAALIEHDVTVGDHCHISTGSIINGGCRVGNSVFVGSNSVLADGVSIVDDVTVGAGTVVIKSITEAGVYVGSPARKVSRSRERISL